MDALVTLAGEETFSPRGNAQEASRLVALAATKAPEDARTRYLVALGADLAGDRPTALEGYASTVLAARPDRPIDAAIAEVALASLSDLEDGVAGWAPRVESLARELSSRSEPLPPAASFVLGALARRVASRNGDAAAVRADAVARGCVTSWRVAGPFGPRELLAFDRAFPPERRGALADGYDLGPGVGPRPTRTMDARGCATNLGAGLELGGVTYAEAFLEVRGGGGEVVLRIETPNPTIVFVDDRALVRRDARSEPLPRTTFHAVSLAPGRHRVLVKVVTRHPNPVLTLSAHGGDTRWVAAGEYARATGAATDDRESDEALLSTGLGRYVLAARRLARGDVIGSREILRLPVRTRDATSAWLLLRGLVALRDPARSRGEGRDVARTAFRLVAQRDSRSWLARLQLARLEAGEGAVARSLDALRDIARDFPTLIEPRLDRADVLAERGWEEESVEELRAAAEVVPDGCRATVRLFQQAARRVAVRDARQWAVRALRCDRSLELDYLQSVAARRWDEASREVERLGAFHPQSAPIGVISSELDIARGRGDLTRVEERLRELARWLPRSSRVVREIVDTRLGAGDTQGALSTLDAALRSDPTAMVDLRRVRDALSGQQELAPFRLDGLGIVRGFLASGRRYDQPSVLVLDYTVVRVYSDGSSITLTHNIFRVQSEDTASQLGEYRPPRDGRVLVLRTVKADGTVLEPDEIAGKETISLPDLEPGDFVEHETLTFEEPPSAYPGGWIGERFFFRGFEMPFDRSELVVVIPHDARTIVDPRGEAPALREETQGDLRVMRWRVDESRPAVEEPASVSTREFMPSVQVAVSATWPGYVESFRDALADRDMRDPEADRVLANVVPRADRAPGRELSCARRAYAWALEHVEHGDDLLGAVMPMIVSRAGDRGRVVRFLAERCGVPAELALVASAGGDRNDAVVPDASAYPFVLVRLRPAGAEPVWLWTNDRGTPFGYLPPVVRGQRALVLTEDGDSTTTPATARDGLFDDRRTLELDVEVAPNGSARVEAVERYTGAGAITWRRLLERIPEAQLERRFEEAYVGRMIAGAELTGLSIEGRRDNDAPVVLRYAYDVPAFGRRQGQRWILPGLYPAGLAQGLARRATRTTPMYTGDAVDIGLVARIRVADGMRPLALPEVAELTAGGARFTSRWRREGAGGRTLVQERRLIVPPVRIEPGDYPRFASFARA
ncbi:MAG: hypothetical protein IT379_09715, partial [Deltaproteobacteria bacterium]|nr:hypothetical protein [Deltaproteobacteria bacterium]